MKKTNTAFTMAGAAQRTSIFGLRTFGHAAFTMAEILLSLTIIGVVAAITLPSLTGNINERTWNTQRKALYSRMSQAISLMPALNGYGTSEDNATETFITAGLSKVLKINNICANNLADCGIVTSYTNMVGAKSTLPTDLYSLNAWFSHIELTDDTGATRSFETPNSRAVAFETQNGESLVAYYNQSCKTEYLNQETKTSSGNHFGFPEATMCVNFIYDLNGKKGPNTIGKDMGIITVFNATDSTVVAPMPSSNVNAGNNEAKNFNDAIVACKNQDPDSRIPNIEELSAMLINKDLINLISASSVWSGTVFNTQRVWDINSNVGLRTTQHKNVVNGYVRCVKR